MSQEHDSGDSFCDCGACRRGRVLDRFRADPDLYVDYAKLAAWWCLEREFPDEKVTAGDVFRIVESPLTKPNAALEQLRSNLRCMFGPVFRKRDVHG